MREAIYAASLDPITHGHNNLIGRALNVFDRIIVAIGINEAKKPLFSLEKREAMAKKELASFGNRVVVKSFNGMLSDFAYMNNITTIIRGARSTPDFDYEKLLGDINRYSGVDTIIYTSVPELSHISSSAAKAITLNCGKNILDFVSMDVKRELEEALLHQYRIGITGVIGSGKSFIANMFSNYCYHNFNKEIHIIDMDHIGHYILEKGREPICKEVRSRLELNTGFKVQEKDGFINVTKLSSIIFNNDIHRQSFNDIMREPMMYLLRQELLNHKGNSKYKKIVIITGALICECGGLSEFNNNLILVDAPEKCIIKRLKEKRKYSNEKIKKRLSAQLSFKNKLNIAKNKIKNDGSGNIWVVKNGLDSGTSFNTTIFPNIINTLSVE